jgi:uncharacterized protein
MASIQRIIRRLFTLPIWVYQKVISPALPAACIYEPTCSHYATDAILRHGPLKGLILAITRVFRCVGGLYTGGKDDVPDTFSFQTIGARYKEFWRGRNRHE